MSKIQKIILGVVALVTLVVGIHSFKGSSAGDATVSNYPTWYYNGIVIGPSNSLVSNVISGSCDLTGASPVADRATETLKCDVATAKVGDHIFMVSDRAGTESNGAFPIIAAVVASPGAIEVIEQNQTGGSATPDASAITDVHYLIVR